MSDIGAKLDRAERWLYDELMAYKVAENVNGAPLNETQREARDAIKTAFYCVQKIKKMEEKING